MATVRASVERLQLGLTLARLRKRARKTQSDAARLIGRTPGRLSQIEKGGGGISAESLAALLDFYEVQGSEREMVIALGVGSRRRQPRRVYVDALPEPFQRMVDLQTAAVRIEWYECGIVPGLVQSPDYVRAVIGNSDAVSWVSSEREVSERVDFRLAQQRALLEARPPKDIDIVFTEDSLRHVMGSREVMRGQVEHLLDLVERYPQLSVRIVPDAEPRNPARGSGLLVLIFETGSPITFPTLLHGPAAYYDQAIDTEHMRRMFNRVKELALSPEDTRTLWTTMLKEESS